MLDLYGNAGSYVCIVSLGLVTMNYLLSNTPPRWINSSGGPFLPNLNIQPEQKLNGGPRRPANHDWKPPNPT